MLHFLILRPAILREKINVPQYNFLNYAPIWRQKFCCRQLLKGKLRRSATYDGCFLCKDLTYCDKFALTYALISKINPSLLTFIKKGSPDLATFFDCNFLIMCRLENKYPAIEN